MCFALSKYFLISSPTFLENEGVWLLKNNILNFSLAHSKNCIVVAISDKKVGVDVEKLDDKILKLKNKLNFESFNTVKDLTLAWTKRESLFKATAGNNYFTEYIIDELLDEYCLTVCTDYTSAEFIRIDLNDFI